MTALPFPELPTGFLAAGVNSGIKAKRRDLGVLLSDRPATFAACLTTNRCRAHPVARAERILAMRSDVRVILATSGNANALTGPEGAEDDEAIATAVAEEVGVDPTEVLTASTGVLAHRLPVPRVIDGIPVALRELTENPLAFAESVMTSCLSLDEVTRATAPPDNTPWEI